jgi:hypothetical protein
MAERRCLPLRAVVVVVVLVVLVCVRAVGVG